MTTLAIELGYIVALSCFILGIKQMNTPRTARVGNFIAALGMLLAILVTLLHHQIVSFSIILLGIAIGSIAGILLAQFISMNAMPQMVALLNGFGGLASALVAWSDYSRAGSHDTLTLITLVLGASIGMLTFTGSCLAYGKLEGWVSPQPVIYPFQQIINLILGLTTVALCVLLVMHQSFEPALWALLALSFVIGVVIILPIGGADMPVVISLLNSFSGVAGAMTGFVLMNNVLIIGGALVGASGLILTQVMCKAMNRSLANVLFGAFGKAHETAAGGKGGKEEYENVKTAAPEEAALILDTASLVILVPGYGLAVSRAQYGLRELAKTLQGRGVTVKYAIHPVAGRMPGHMNVLLAEAEVPYEELYEMDAINPEFEQADVAIVVGANDVTNPRANTDPQSPIYGMPVLNVGKAKSVLVIKRSLAPGFSGIKNPLFENEKTMMLFGDAKPVIEQLTKELKNLS